MKAYKYTFVLAVLFLITNSITAQVSFGIKGAVNMFNMSVKDNNDDKVTTKMLPTWNAGVFAELPLTTEFFVRPELVYAVKGYKNEDNDTKVSLSYVELPVTFLYKAALTGGNVMIGFGPYIAMGIGGKVKNGSSSDIKFKNDITQQENSQNFYKPLDAGAKVYAGYELNNGLSFSLETSLGLVNIKPKVAGNDNGDAKNVGFGFAIGYRFH